MINAADLIEAAVPAIIQEFSDHNSTLSLDPRRRVERSPESFREQAPRGSQATDRPMRIPAPAD